MAIRYPITLSTTEPNNNIGLLKIRQADEETQTLVVEITENSLPKSYEGLQVFFCAKLGQSAGLGIIEQKLNPSEMTDPKSGKLEYTMRAEDWQQLGRQTAYFSFRKMTDDHTYIEQFSTRDFYYNVLKNIFSDGVKEVKKDGSTYVWTFEDLLRLFKEFMESGRNDFDAWYAEVKDQFYSFLGDSRADFDKWYEEIRNLFQEYMDSGRDDFDGWYKEIKDQLSEDAAGNLMIIYQNLRDKIGKDSDFREFEFDQSFMQRVKNETSERGVNVKWFGAKGDGVTDDTQAVKSAIGYVCSLVWKIESLSSWQGHIPSIYFPAGIYRLTEPGALNCVGTAIRGYNLRGDTYQSSTIYFDYEPMEDEEAFLLTNGDNNWFGFSYIEDLAFQSNGKCSIWRVKTRAGSPQACRFRRVSFTNIKNCVSVEYGTANVNGDLFRFESCKASYINGYVFGIPGVRNSQSIVHSFDDCDFETISGTILYFKSGGSVEVRGGSWILSRTGRVIHAEDSTGAGIGTSNNFVTFYGTKFEWQFYDTSDINLYYPLAYDASMMSIKFVRCNFGQFGESGRSQYPFTYQSMGSLILDGCFVPSSMGFGFDIMTNAALGINHPRLELTRCRLNEEINKKLVSLNGTEFPAFSNKHNLPNVVVSGCTCEKYLTPVDVDWFSRYGYRFTSGTTKNFVVRKLATSRNNGLPALSATSGTEKLTFNMPVGSILKRLHLVNESAPNGTIFNHKIYQSSNSSVNLLSTEFQPNKGSQSFTSSLFNLAINTENEQEITIECTSGTSTWGSIGGYVEVEYV